MSTNVTWANGVTYSIPGSGEVNWPTLSAFLIALGNDASIDTVMKQAIRVATTTPVTVSNSSDCVVLSNLTIAGAVAVTLPAGTAGRFFIVGDQKGDAATNNITITPNGAETINGSATYVIGDNRGCVILAYSTTNTRWNVVARFTAGAAFLSNTLTSAHIFVGNASNLATDVAMSGEGSLSNTGAFTLANTLAGVKTFTNGIATSSFVAPTVQKFTSGTSLTYNLPSSPRAPLYIRVRMVGGGGGGGGGGNVGGVAGQGGNGTATSFGTLSASGGVGGLGGGAGGISAGGTAGLGAGGWSGTTLSGGSGGAGGFAGGSAVIYYGGGNGGSNAFGGGGGGGSDSAVSNVGGTGAANTGAGGGGGGGKNGGGGSGSGGGAGGFLDAIIGSPTSTYTYSVGSSGTPGASGTGGQIGGPGSAGYIEVTEYYQ